MKAIVNTGPDKLEMLELPMPETKAGQVRIHTAACGICATDLDMIHGWDRTGFPSIPGHEWSGIGDYEDIRANFSWNLILHKEIELIGSNASAGAWPEAVRLAVEEKLPLERLISHRFHASEFEKGIELRRNRDEKVIKVVLEWL